MGQPLSLVGASAIGRILDAEPRLAITEAGRAYGEYHRGGAINPPSQFLRLEDSNRIISLLAATQSPPVAGCKVVSSWPKNVKMGQPRASALIILHDRETGVPHAVIDGRRINIARTTASAVLAVRHLADPEAPPRSLSVIGTGAIAAGLIETFVSDRWRFERVGCHDLDPAAARTFALRSEARCGWRLEPFATLTAALDADIVAFTTTAATPYVVPPHAFRPGQIVLNISLRDIAPELLLAAENIVDDVDHCLRAETSPHLAEQLIGDRRFITGTLGEVMAGALRIDHRKAVIFSPFGLGILDVTLAHAVWQRAEANGSVVHLEDFLGGDDRWH